MTSSLQRSFVFGTLSLLFILSVHATTLLTPTDTRVVSDQTTPTSLGTVTTGTSASFSTRSREDTGQNDRQVVSFFQFDVSSFSVSDVNDPGFSAIFRIDQFDKINTTTNILGVGIGRNAGGSWDSSGSNNPLHDWGFVDETDTVAAADGQILIPNVALTTPPQNDLTADVSTIVKDWIEGTHANHGFVLYYDVNSYQAAGFNDPELLVTIPEPSMMGMLAFGLLLLRLRHRQQDETTA